MQGTIIKTDAVCIIGKQGSTQDGEGFIERLWQDANSHFGEVESLVRRNAQGQLCGIWGAMTDFSGEFMPWEDGFSRGLYLAGVECDADAQAPEGWTRWVLPAFEYLQVKMEGEDTFSAALHHMAEQQLPLVGAVQEFTNPNTGESYLRFPIRRL